MISSFIKKHIPYVVSPKQVIIIILDDFWVTKSVLKKSIYFSLFDIK